MRHSPSRRPRAGARPRRAEELSTPRLERLIREAVVDCYNQSEAVTGFVTMIEDHLGTPFVCNVLGVEVVVEGIELTREESIVAPLPARPVASSNSNPPTSDPKTAAAGSGVDRGLSPLGGSPVAPKGSKQNAAEDNSPDAVADI